MDKIRIEEINCQESARLTNLISDLDDQVRRIDLKIENSKDSLYGWLNIEFPGWEQTIGKVIDEENLLFRSGLSPVKVGGDSPNFYGISIDLNEISKEVKTIADYRNEKG